MKQSLQHEATCFAVRLTVDLLPNVTLAWSAMLGPANGESPYHGASGELGRQFAKLPGTKIQSKSKRKSGTRLFRLCFLWRCCTEVSLSAALASDPQRR